MSGLDERRKAMEAELHLNSELKFRVRIRRNKFLGLWAAELLSLTGPAAVEYARQVVMADFQEIGDLDVTRKVLGDLMAAGMTTTKDAVQQKVDNFALVAHDQIQHED